MLEKSKIDGQHHVSWRMSESREINAWFIKFIAVLTFSNETSNFTSKKIINQLNHVIFCFIKIWLKREKKNILLI